MYVLNDNCHFKFFLLLVLKCIEFLRRRWQKQHKLCARRNCAVRSTRKKAQICSPHKLQALQVHIYSVFVHSVAVSVPVPITRFCMKNKVHMHFTAMVIQSTRRQVWAGPLFTYTSNTVPSENSNISSCAVVTIHEQTTNIFTAQTRHARDFQVRVLTLTLPLFTSSTSHTSHTMHTSLASLGSHVWYLQDAPCIYTVRAVFVKVCVWLYIWSET